jgi:hypothetical protein
MTENSDALWDDGVAPELALDFDASHISTREATYTWLGAFLVFATVFQVIKASSPITVMGNNNGNPALSHAVDVVVPDYSNHDAVPLGGEEQ